MKRFGIWGDWRVYFEHRYDPYAYATYHANYLGQAVTFRFNTEWEDGGTRPLTKVEIERTAKHEAIHLLTTDLYLVANSRFATQDEIDKANETLVRRLENLL